MTLRRSEDRKVSVHHGIGIGNSFGLPAGISCPGMTTLCGKVCYAKKIEQMPYLKAVRDNLRHNWQSLKDATYAEMVNLLNEMIVDFKAECVKGKRNYDAKFRIHWDGDFFSRSYTEAWATVISKNPDVQFWAYTRSFDFVDALNDLHNLALYLSVDEFNLSAAVSAYAKNPWVKVAALASTQEGAAEIVRLVTNNNRPGAKCPENIGAIPLMTGKKGACISCNLCVAGKADVRFATGKK